MTDIFPDIERNQSISFRCPRCNNFCGFQSKLTGKRARCTQCQCRFVIPSKSGQVPVIVKDEIPEPETGFFTSVFVRTWKTIFNLSSIEGLVFVFAAVCFEFFLRDSDYSVTLPGFRLQLPIGLVTVIIARGCLFWYYAEVISWTAMETESLPDIGIGTGFEFIWNIIKCNYLFLVSLIFAVFPFVVIGSILRSVFDDLPLYVNFVLIGCGLFLTPIVMLSMFTSRHMWQVFRVDCMFVAIFRCFGSYVVVACIFLTACFLYWLIMFNTLGGYADLKSRGGMVVILYLFANLGVTLLTIFSMRTIGLFCRHYRVYLPHTWAMKDEYTKLS